MRASLATILIAACLLLAAGSIYVDGCAVPCPHESPDRDCPPDCVFCACCVGTRPAIVEAARIGSPLLVRGMLAEDPALAPAPPIVRDILHVPKIA